ncbi:MAG TPA: hypothetical protein VFI47_01750 [Acidimicrobiales bacterium]|nr:hypothetical protein [Acidimicrobiales bacterium]
MMGEEDPATRRARRGLAAMMVGSGALHFAVPSTYVKIVPRWLGDRRRVVLVSGALEVAAGGLLLSRRTRRAGGWLTAALLVAVFPANVQMVLDAGTEHQAAPNVPAPLFRAAGLARLPGQVPMIRRALRVARS